MPWLLRVSVRQLVALVVVGLVAVGGAALPAWAGPLLPPSGVTARAESGPQVTVEWQRQNVPYTYRVLRSRTSGGPYTQVAETPQAYTTSVTDTAVEPLTTYYYVVQTIDGQKVSRYSTEASATTGPETPENVRASADVDRVDLTWDRASGATRYEVIDVTPTQDQEVVRGSTTTESFTDTDVTNDSWYHYKIRAIAPNGATEDSTVIPVHTGAPSKTTITVSPTETGQRVLWTAKVAPRDPLSTNYAGTVVFSVDGSPLDVRRGLNGNLDPNDHTYREVDWAGLPEGEHIIYAHYYGYGALGASSSAIKVHVVKPAYGEVSFDLGTLYLFGENSQPISAATADLNGDGRLDAVTTTSTRTGDPDDFRLFRFEQPAQPGALTFKPSRATHGQWKSTMRIGTGDIDRDGDEDIAVTVHGGVDVFRQSDGRLTGPTFISTGTTEAWFFRDARLADMNGDRRADLVIQAGQRVEIRHSLGGGKFAAPVVVARVARHVEAADLDGDGDRDILTWAGSDIVAYRQTAGHSYERWFRRTVPHAWSGPVSAAATGDVDGDGRSDIVITTTGNAADSRVLVYRRTSTGFASPVTYPVRDMSKAVALADVNQDGLNDVIVAHGSYEKVGVMLQRPDSFLGREQEAGYQGVDVTDDHRGLAVGDLTGDGHLDIAVIAPNQGLLVIPTF